MSAQDTALIVSTAGSPMVAIVVSVIAYRATQNAAKVAKDTADADRALERERLEGETKRSHLTWLLEQKRRTYVDVLSVLESAYWLSARKSTVSQHEAVQLDDKLRLTIASMAVFASDETYDAYLSAAEGISEALAQRSQGNDVGDPGGRLADFRVAIREDIRRATLELPK